MYKTKRILVESLQYCGCAVRIAALDAAAVTDVSPGAVVKIFVALSAFSDFDVNVVAGENVARSAEETKSVQGIL